MEIISKIKELVAKPVNAAYQCWICGEGHNDAITYLWHIRNCNEIAGKPALLQEQRAVLPAMTIKQ